MNDSTLELDTRQYQEIFSLLKGDKQALLISGSAGTGKTTFIEYIQSPAGVEQFPPAAQMAIVAPTGVAAMRAGGATIHSLFEFPPEVFDYDRREFVGGERITVMEHKEELLRNINLLVIDEVSMVRADLMDAINLSLQVHRQDTSPFGGVRMLFIGDLFQLQPVVTVEDAKLFAELYPDKTGMFFFESLAFDELRARGKLACFELSIPYRFGATEAEQRAEFPLMLERIRRGDTSDLSQINRYLSRPTHYQKLLEDGAVLLTSRRNSAEGHNKSKLNALAGKEQEFIGEAEGKCVYFEDNRLPAPRQLSLKEGARVIFVRNDADGKWRNGSLGYVEDFGVDDEKEAYIQVRLDKGQSVKVKRETWEIISYAYDRTQKRVVTQEEGRYEQFPLMLSWALTIHRAQGQTLEKAVVDLGGGAFSAGQTYVALSRCRQAKDLGLMRALRERDLICHAAASEFYDKIFKKHA